MNLSLPASLSETEREEKRKIKLFAPLSASERGWGRGQIRLVELTLKSFLKNKIPDLFKKSGILVFQFSLIRFNSYQVRVFTHSFQRFLLQFEANS
ncbi:hypothetical protein CDG76_11920 [Nostoc sp. 'Peltigera membranacea cyanobiont' 210A]|nr:hypothetical protein CDG76_11920 [Nostoc sp. 'Peltigera membranacea cyanobiont' 210A]